MLVVWRTIKKEKRNGQYAHLLFNCCCTAHCCFETEQQFIWKLEKELKRIFFKNNSRRCCPYAYGSCWSTFTTQSTFSQKTSWLKQFVRAKAAASPLPHCHYGFSLVGPPPRPFRCISVRVILKVQNMTTWEGWSNGQKRVFWQKKLTEIFRIMFAPFKNCFWRYVSVNFGEAFSPKQGGAN